MGQILSGKILSEKLLSKIALERAELKAEDVVLTVISVGDDPASAVYIRNKKRACEKVGFVFNHITLDCHSTKEDILNAIKGALGQSSGLIVQLPIVSDKTTTKEVVEITSSVPVMVDVDGFGADSKMLIYEGYEHYLNPMLPCKPHLPCTPHGIIDLLDSIDGLTLEGKTALVIGRSDIVGKPIANMLMDRGCTVTIAHSHTSYSDLQTYADNADIIVSAVGKPNVLNKIYTTRPFNPIIIDVGMNHDANGKLCGDLTEEMKNEYSSYYTPVPGGVGPMTVAELIQNTWNSWKAKRLKNNGN